MFCRKTILKLLENAAMEPAPPLKVADDVQKVSLVTAVFCLEIILIKVVWLVVCLSHLLKLKIISTMK